MSNDRNKLIQEFKEARETLKKAIDKFPTAKREIKLFDKWSLKDVIAHISGWDHYTVNLIKNFKASTETEWGLSVNKYNEKEVAKRKDWSWDKVYLDFIEMGKQIDEEYNSLPDELFDKKFWKGKNHTPNEFIKIDIEHYVKEHLPEIKKFTK